MVIPPLPDCFTLRRPALTDLEAVLSLYNSFDIPKYGQPNQSLESIQTRWTAPDFDLAVDAWLVIAPDGKLVGYIHVAKDEQSLLIEGTDVHLHFFGQMA